VNKISRLLDSYRRFIALPWQDAAAAQRVIFCVYDEGDERRLRARIEEFDLATIQAQHRWLLFDLSDSFADWLGRERYAQRYFAQPMLLATLMPRYLKYLEQQLSDLLTSRTADANTVVALAGVGSLFGFLKVKDVVDTFAPLVHGRLLVFFPGSYENNNYRLLDGYDGWNYLAVPLTAE
jgi:hypothetical protein